MTMKKARAKVLDPLSNDGIPSIASGVPGFDAVVGGGLPEFSFNLIAGNPGSGKTTLAQQIMFANASVKRPALYFSVLGEPTLKMLRYQRGFSFFDPRLVGTAIQYINLSEEALEQDLTRMLDRIASEVERVSPGMVVVDSFRTMLGRSGDAVSSGLTNMENFIQRLALNLNAWEVTTLIIGQSAEQDQRNPIFTVADSVFWLSQVTDRNSVVRKMQALKVRGRSSMPGLHTFRITSAGLQIFPRIPEQQSERRPPSMRRLSSGIPGLDEAMGGGVFAGDAVLLGGPAGSGKTTFATQFAAEGLRVGEAVVIVVFEEYPEEYLARAKARNQDIAAMIEARNFRLIYLRPLDLSVDETAAEIFAAVTEIGATRVVIDSLSGFQIALAPAFRIDFQESLYRLVGALTSTGVTIFMTTEITSGYPDASLTSERVSFITDDIIVQRFVEIDGELRTVLAVPKMRGSKHSHDLLTYIITDQGAVVGGPLRSYRGILTGSPEFQPQLARGGRDGLTDRESAVLETLVRLGATSRDTLAEHVGVQPLELEATLRRLALLGYAVVTRTGGDTYRAIAQVET
ncbi:MAG: ATPase domain-containing protein [Gemmatimonadota bacterium]